MPTLRSKYGELLDHILNDTRDASPRFVAMQNALKQAADVDSSQNSDLEKNVELLGRLRDFADSYLDNHGGFHGTRKGRERYAWAKELRAAADQLYSDVQTRYQGDIEKNLQFEKRVDQDESLKNDLSHLQRLGKLQRNIGTANFVPQKKDFDLKPSRWERFKYSVSRGLGHLFNGIFGMTTGLLTLTAAAPFTTTGKYEKLANQQESDLTLVPGTKTDEHFEELHPENGPDDQEICADKRRVPINYEELIPEDPNEPPTMTLCFEQSGEGSTSAMGGDEGQGHAFISLKYTKNNPLTGKPERYKCTFGFYPHQDVNNGLTSVAMGTSGTVIPGSIVNDATHGYSTSKTFTVTNKTINTIFKEAEGYAKGGYNYVTRSCATFAHDMAVAAGLPADDYFAKTDFEGSMTNIIKGGSYFLGSRALSRLGKHAMLQHAADNTTEYARFGQKQINREDVQRLSQRKDNIRLKGYVPSVAAEAARNNWDFHLGSNRYVPKVAAPKDEKISFWRLNHARLIAENNQLMHTVGKFLKKNSIPRDQSLTILKNLVNFLDTNNRILDEYGKVISPSDYKVPKESFPTLEGLQKATFGAVKALKDYKEGLDHIFRSSFKSDKRLNIPFQHMVSTLQKLDNELAQSYRVQQERFFHEEKNLYEDSHIRNYLDPKAENFCSLARLKFSTTTLPFGSHHFGDSKYRPEELAGIVKAFGSLDNYGIENDNVIKLRNEHGKNSSKYKEALNAFSKKKEAADHFASALSTLAGKKSFSRHDLDFAFRELPAGTRDVDCTDPQASPTDIYQSLILTSYCSGLHDALESSLKKAKENFLEQRSKLEESKADLSGSEYAKRMTDLKQEVKNSISKTAFDVLAEKLENCPDFDHILDLMRKGAADADGIDLATANSDQKSMIDEYVYGNFDRLLTAEILTPMTNTINAHTEPKGDEYAEADFSSLLAESFKGQRSLYCEGGERLSTLFHNKFDSKIFKDAAVYVNARKADYEQSLRNESENAMAEKKQRDLETLSSLQQKELEDLDKLAKDGKSSPDDPEVSGHLSKLMAIGVVNVTMEATNKTLNEPVNDALISKKAEGMQQDGVLDHLKQPENQKLVNAAAHGDEGARNQLVKQTMANLRKASFRAAQNSIRENSPSKDLGKRPSRRMSSPQRRKSSPDIPE